MSRDPGADPQGMLSVGQIAERLQQDPVLVQPLFGNGRTSEVDTYLTQLVDRSEIPVYVVMAQTPPDLERERPGEDLVARLHAQVGDDGLYVVAYDPDVGRVSWETYGSSAPDSAQVDDWLQDTEVLFDDQDFDAPDQAASGAVATLVDGIAVQDLQASGEDLAAYRSDTLWMRPARPSEAPEAGTFALVSTSSGTVALLVVLFCLRQVAIRRSLTRAGAGAGAGVTGDCGPSGAMRMPANRRTGAGAASGLDPAEVVAAAEAERTALTELLARESDAARAGRGREHDRLLDGSRDTAAHLLARIEAGSTTHRSDPLLDSLGALVLIRTAARAASGGRPYRPCFSHPWHGEGVAEVSAELPGGSAVAVPVCDACRRSDPALREVLLRPGRWGRWGRPRAYYDGDSVWAETGFGAFGDDLWRRVASGLESS